MPESAGGCPVDHGSVSTVGSCPVDKGNTGTSEVYNVYSQRVDPSNQMPVQASQLPAPGQSKPMSTERVVSSIPKGNTSSETWTYPSPQMFYNALARKNKLGDMDEDGVATVVAIHNNMNEHTWKEVLRWERHNGQDVSGSDPPKLLKFVGRPHTLSPKARMLGIFSGEVPFDRHDWTVKRGNGTEVRYVIDYYYKDRPLSAEDVDKQVLMNELGRENIRLDVRPALDSVDSVFQRLSMTARDLLGFGTNVDDVPIAISADGPKATTSTSDEAKVDGGAEFDYLRNMTSTQVDESMVLIGERCAKFNEELSQCGDDPDKCRQADYGLRYCMASVVCKKQANNFIRTLESGTAGDEDEARAYNSMVACLQRYSQMAVKVKAAARS